MPKIFVVEDDEIIRDLIIYVLQSNQFEAEGFETGRDFFNALNKSVDIPLLVLLDIMLPESDGFIILKELRRTEKYKNIPVIIISAKTSEMDKVKALNAGADDYISKPFGVLEIIARINAVLRRSSDTGLKVSYKNISIDKECRVALADGEKVMLTYKEYELLNYLILNADIVVSRDKIIENIWGYDYDGESRTVDMHIKTLRQKLGAAGEHIKTVRHVGYKLGE